MLHIVCILAHALQINVVCRQDNKERWNEIKQMASAVANSYSKESFWIARCNPIVVVGAGPAGIHVVNELLRWNPQCPIVIYGGEPWNPYARVKLSSLLAGEVRTNQLENQLRLPDIHHVYQRYNCPIVSINRHDRSVIDSSGRTQPYSKLILATGSQPHIPSIPGIHRKGIFTFRDMGDAQQLLARQMRSRRTIVLGGGVLGLEVARAMQRANTEVYVIEHSTRLMFNQLDEASSESLRSNVLKMGIRVVLNNGVQEIVGGTHVEGVRLRNGRCIDCDTLIIATGVRASVKLAVDAGLRVGKGIQVNDFLQTIDPNIYAIGECCEHREQVYGLLTPGLEQAGVAAHNIAHKKTAKYHGSLSLTQLKVVGCPVFSAGVVADMERASVHRSVVYENASLGIYRKLVFCHRQLVGVIALGDVRDTFLLQHAIESKKTFWPWQIYRFQRTGSLWSQRQSDAISQWPGIALVCPCRGVTRAQLTNLINDGSDSLHEIIQKTGAATVCNACRSHLAEMCETRAEKKPRGLSAAFIATTIVLILLLGIGFGAVWGNPEENARAVVLADEQNWHQQ